MNKILFPDRQNPTICVLNRWLRYIPLVAMLNRQRILLYLIQELRHKSQFTKTAVDEYFEGARSQVLFGGAHPEGMLPPKASLSVPKGFSPRSIHKVLFLLLKEYGFGEKAKFYSFYPYKFGPFSQLFYYDLRKMESVGCLEGGELTALGAEEAGCLETELKECIKQAIARFPSAKKLIDYVYARYPDYLDGAFVRQELFSNEPTVRGGSRGNENPD